MKSGTRDRLTPDEMLMCHVEMLAYDFERRLGNVHFPFGHCCDMTGCIEFFKRIDPNVAAIVTFSGPYEDTRYVLIPPESRHRVEAAGHSLSCGGWLAILPAESRWEKDRRARESAV